MSEQSATSQDSGGEGWQFSPQTANAVSIGMTETRRFTKHACPGCGERVESHTDTCPACGEHLAHAPKQIRCMHCHTPASSELIICPGCGRELREAPSRAITVGMPALLALLLMALVVSQWERVSPIAWARSNLVRGVILVEDLSASIEPEMVIVMTPIVEEVVGGHDSTPDASNVVVAAGSIIVSDTQAVAMNADASVVTPLPADDIGQNDVGQNDGGQENNPASVLESQESPIGVGGPRATELAAASIAVPDEVSSTAVPATDTPLPTATPEPPTPIPADETGAAEGLAATLSTEELRTPTPTWTVAANNAPERSTAIATVTPEATASTAVASPTTTVPPANGPAGGIARASALAVSEATPANGPSSSGAEVATTGIPTPTATPTPVIYQVRTGDTLVTIAAKYDVEVEALMEANNISAQDVFVLQPGQMLYVPVPVASSEPVVAAAGISPALRLEAPALVVPPDDARIGCTTGGKLIWQRVQFVKDSDKYVLHLGFVNGETADGQEDVVWILAQSGPVTQTEWELDGGLCDLAPDQFDHEWRWWVEVVEEVDGQPVSVSPPSVTRGFVWE
jgi:LysM repeat protein